MTKGVKGYNLSFLVVTANVSMFLGFHSGDCSDYAVLCCGGVAL